MQFGINKHKYEPEGLVQFGVFEKFSIREKLRHQLRHPGRALDLKAKDLIGHL